MDEVLLVVVLIEKVVVDAIVVVLGAVVVPCHPVRLVMAKSAALCLKDYHIEHSTLRVLWNATVTV